LKTLGFDTDGVAVAGTGTETNSGETSIHLPQGARIMALKQAVGAVPAQDADWTLWVDYRDTGQVFLHNSLLVTNDGGVKLGPTGLRIHPGAIISWHWVQTVAQANHLEMYYE